LIVVFRAKSARICISVFVAPVNLMNLIGEVWKKDCVRERRRFFFFGCQKLSSGGNMRQKTLLTVAALVVLLVGAPTVFASPNLLTNGSFETGDFTGWNQSGLEEVVTGGFYVYPGAQDGNFYSVWGNVGGDGQISQSFSDTAGAHYTFSFWFASVGDVPSDFSASWDSTTLLSLSNPNTGVNYTEYSFAVTGTGSDTITFTGRDDPAWMALDNISVTPSTGTTPEPSSLLLLGSGLLAVGGVIRRKFRAGR
jgi:PEP-CTERM motif-containing protein